MLAQLKAHLMQEVTLFTLKDRLTGTEVHKFTLGRNWHWYLIFALALLRLVLKYT